jgi:2'-5' RNA ligase
MRCFIATDINEKIRKALGDLQQQLQDQTGLSKSDVKWVKPENVHLTLKFLGEIKDAESVKVCDIVRDVAQRHKCFELDIETVGRFGGRSARVLWVGIGAGSENLCRLQKDLDQQLASAGWQEDERDFTGHLTLCRIKNPKAGIKLAQSAEEHKNLKLGTVLANSVSVYQSQLTPTGPVYTVIGNYKLQ